MIWWEYSSRRQGQCCAAVELLHWAEPWLTPICQQDKSDLSQSQKFSFTNCLKFLMTLRGRTGKWRVYLNQRCNQKIIPICHFPPPKSCWGNSYVSSSLKDCRKASPPWTLSCLTRDWWTICMYICWPPPCFHTSSPPPHFVATEHPTKEKYKFKKSLLLSISVLQGTVIYCVTNICTADNNTKIISILIIKTLTSFFC